MTMIRLRLVPPLLLPSIVTLDTPFNLISAPLARDPVRVAVTETAGLMSRVYVPEAQPVLFIVFKAIVPASVMLASTIDAVTLPVRPRVLIALNKPVAPVRVVYVPAVPIVTVPLKPAEMMV